MQKASLELAHYRSIQEYVPRYSDIIIWARIFTYWFGVVNGINDNELSIVFEGTPRLLLTMLPEEIESSTYLVKLSDIRAGKRGSWYAQQVNDGKAIWYI